MTTPEDESPVLDDEPIEFKVTISKTRSIPRDFTIDLTGALIPENPPEGKPTPVHLNITNIVAPFFDSWQRAKEPMFEELVKIGLSPVKLDVEDIITPITAVVREAYQSILQGTWETNTAFFQNILEGIKPIIGESFQALDELELSLAGIGPVFVEAGFWFTRSTSLGLIRQVRILHEKGALTPESLTALLLEWYRADNYRYLRETINSWYNDLLFVPRMHIFEDAFDAHVQGKYTLTIPALLPHIEGIAKDIVSNYVQQLSANNKGAIAQKVINELFSERFSGVMRDALLAFVTNNAYYHFGFEELEVTLKRLDLKPSLFLNRHAILHGAHVEYASEVNSLRAFLLLDALTDAEIMLERQKRRMSNKP